MKVFLTGAAGFIGFHTALALLKKGHEVFGYDAVNNYYDPKYKENRLSLLHDFDRFTFRKGLLENEALLSESYRNFEPSHVLHLAAQAGVRYSLEHPHAYIQSNVVGFQNIIELVRHSQPEHFVYASSSSVYGGNKEFPFHEKQNVSHPISLYAATKLANELVARTYGHLYGIKNTGLRFFTVYGPHGRPDMALFKFAHRMLKGEAIEIYNYGNMIRDFTYIDDIVDGVLSALSHPQMNKVYNLGRGKKELLKDMIAMLEKALGVDAKKEFLPIQPGDVEETFADTSAAREDLGYKPTVNLEQGIPQFVRWYQEAH